MAHVFVAQAPELADVGACGEFAAGDHHAVSAENSLRRTALGALEGLPAGVVVDIFIPHSGDQIFRLPLEGIPGTAVVVSCPPPVEQGIAEPGGGSLVGDVPCGVIGRLADRFTVDHIDREVLVGEEHPSGGDRILPEERKRTVIHPARIRIGDRHPLLIVQPVLGAGQRVLFLLAGAVDGLRPLPCLVERRQQHRGENGDDRNNNEKFDQRE